MNPHDEMNELVKKFEEDFIGHMLDKIILKFEKRNYISQRKKE